MQKEILVVLAIGLVVLINLNLDIESPKKNVVEQWKELKKNSKKEENKNFLLSYSNGDLGKWNVVKINNWLSLNNTILIELRYSGGSQSYLADYNMIVTDLTMEIIEDNQSELNIRIKDTNNYHFTLPHKAPFAYTKQRSRMGSNLYSYEIPQIGKPFRLKVSRVSSGEVIFDTKDYVFVFSNQYLELSTAITNDALFGLGERRTKTFQFLSGNYSFWNKDQYMKFDDRVPDGQTYGYHSVYLRKDSQSSNWHAVLLRSVSGMLIEYQASQQLTYKLIGGILEFKFFFGDIYPETTVKLYHNYINGWAMHPFWAMGYHQCRWGYNTSESMVTVINQFQQFDLPVDVIWSDIDYMVDYFDFTIDQSRYNLLDMKNMMNLQTTKGVHWVPIIDAGVAIPTDGAVKGADMGVFIKSSQYDGKNLVGCVWPGKTFFTDFNHPSAQEFWTDGLMNITKNYGLNPSGFWTDMNEYSNFMIGEISIDSPCPPMMDPAPPVKDDQVEKTKKETKFLKEDKKDKIKIEEENENVATLKAVKGGLEVPFNPTQPNPLDHQTLSLDSYHYSESDAAFITTPQGYIYEYDFHNLNGFFQTIATNNALKQMGHRLPFIISRSTIFGSGVYAQHWTGDNGASWDFLFSSINEIFNFQLFGIPFTGVDICGFAMNTWPELCARWMQLGLFYPFSRNHNANDTISQEPYAFPNYPYVLSSSRASMKLRYSLLKFYYHLFVRQNGIGTVFRPLFFEFPNENNIYSLSTEFMLADSLLFTPVLQSGDSTQNTTTIETFIPQSENFYDFYTGVKAKPGYNNITVPFDATVPMYLREGKIIHLQQSNGITRSRQLDNHFQLYLAFNSSNQKATGTILAITDYTDDNIIDRCSGTNNCLINITAELSQIGDQFTIDVYFRGSSSKTIYENIYIDSLSVYGLQDFLGKEVNKIITLQFTQPVQVNGDNIQGTVRGSF